MTETKNDIRSPVIVDLGKRKRKDVRRLRRGQGRLMDDIRDAATELESAGTLRKGAQMLIVVVESKQKDSDWMAWTRDNDDDDDDDDDDD